MASIVFFAHDYLLTHLTYVYRLLSCVSIGAITYAIFVFSFKIEEYKDLLLLINRKR